MIGCMDLLDFSQLVGRLAADRHDFAEVFRAATLSITVARWPAGSVDDQQPHSEDEVYYVVRGRARLRISGEAGAVGPGTVAFVAAGVEHRFEEIAEDLEVLVIWSPPRHTNARS
jgi:mannose-6-phosphate isomerase-like protein (cupin superfamily)